ncbi:MAG: hypothetical protein JO061_18655 [Acidobacteriaceae bacterium]|nr:hypothetical protein [Acidobacteriaceae bacterium]
MPNTYLDHPAEDALERFLLHRSDEEETDVVETHILACESCVTRLEALEIELAAMKLALQEFHKEQVEKAVAKQQVTWRNWFTLPRLSMAGGVAALALGIAIAPQFVHTGASPADVNLVAYRGLESPVLPIDRPLSVHLNANGIAENRVKVELVSNNGKQVWQDIASVNQNRINIEVPKITQPGTYLFRVSDAGTQSELREFSFEIK